MVRVGNVFKLNNHLWIVYDVQDTHVRVIDFSHSNCLGGFSMKSEFYNTSIECCGNEDCPECHGTGCVEKEKKRSGMDEAEILAESVEDYILKCLKKPFDF